MLIRTRQTQAEIPTNIGTVQVKIGDQSEDRKLVNLFILTPSWAGGTFKSVCEYLSKAVS